MAGSDGETMLLDASAAARELSLSKVQVYALAKSGELPSLRIRRSVRFRRETLATYLAELEAAEAAAKNAVGYR